MAAGGGSGGEPGMKAGRSLKPVAPAQSGLMKGPFALARSSHPSGTGPSKPGGTGTPPRNMELFRRACCFMGWAQRKSRPEAAVIRVSRLAGDGDERGEAEGA